MISKFMKSKTRIDLIGISQKICGLILGAIFSFVLAVNINASTVYMYESVGETNSDTITMQGKTDVTYLGNLDMYEMINGAAIDSVILDLKESGVVSLHLSADVLGDINRCYDDLRVIIMDSQSNVLRDTDIIIDGFTPDNVGYGDDGKIYYHWEEFFEQGSYRVCVYSNKELSYQLHTYMYPFALSDTLANLKSSSYMSTYTAGSGTFYGSILNLYYENSGIISDGYKNYIRVVIPKTGYYKINFAGNGVAYFEMTSGETISMSADAAYEEWYSSGKLNDMAISGIDYNWLETFGGYSKTVYLSAGTYNACIVNSVIMIPSHVACYTLSIDETVNPQTTTVNTENTSVNYEYTTNDNYQVTTSTQKPTTGIQNTKPKVNKVTNLHIKSVKSKKMKIGWNKVRGANGYQIKYSTNKSMKKAVKVKNIKGNKKTTTLKIQKKKTYYVKARAYKNWNSKKVYGKWSNQIVSVTKKWYFGSQLKDDEKRIYETLDDISDFTKYYYKYTGYGKYGKGIKIKLKGSYNIHDEKKLAEVCQKAGDAFLRDNTELYWIKFFNYSYMYDFSTGEMRDFMIYPVDYYDGVRNDIKQTDKELDNAIKYVKKFSSRYDKVKAAHDYVAKKITYSTDVTSKDQWYYHTVTAGLLDKYKNLGVCESYAKQFGIICKANGIPCIQVCGDGGTTTKAAHMWNYVQMEDGKWYMVDITWDDDGKDIYNTYFLAGTETVGYNNCKVKNSHLPSGLLIGEGYKPFKLPKLAKYRYVN